MEPDLDFSGLHVAALAGGVGGARLAQGLAALLPAEQLSIIVNTGDDFEHLGLAICPDLDTVTYTLAGLSNPAAGWGLADETYHCLEALGKLGGPDWFRLGDRDLATHLVRTSLLRSGMRLTQATGQITQALGVRHAILPMCDMPVHTRVITDQGELDFQEYFVHFGWQPRLTGLRWEGIEEARPSAEVLAALDQADLVVMCPSNPFVSIDPILLLPGIRPLLQKRLVVAVSPILGGKTVKGPAAKMFQELGIEPSAPAVAEHYQDVLDGFVLDEIDAALQAAVETLGMAACAIPTLMSGLDERKAVAQGVLEFAKSIKSGKRG